MFVPVNNLYPIVDASVCDARGLEPRDVAAACLRGGARLLQLRVKGSGSAAFLALVDDVVAMAASYDATVIVNDRVDIAAMAGAGGVHVGQDDLPVEQARAILGDRLIGVSTHDEQQVDEALASPADYVAVGPIFGTSTKNTGYTGRGLDLVRYGAGRGKPIVAIGGITLERAPLVIAAGAAMVAVITDLLVTSDVETRVREHIRALTA